MMVKGLYIMNQDTFELVYPESVRREIGALADIYRSPMTSQQMKEDLSVLNEAEVIFSGWGGPRLDHSLIQAAPNLKAFFYAAGSLKNIATDASWEHEMIITNAVKANAVPVAEFTLSQILFCLKKGWAFTRRIRNTKQFPEKPFDIPGAFGSTVGIVSLSTVGRMVCELLKPFDIHVIGYDPYINEEEAKKLGVELCSLDELFRNADVVSLHTPLLEETKGMIRYEHFAQMPANSSFINTSRGAIVRESEMIEALKKRSDITAVLDVTFPEPPNQDSLLYQLENVVLTPHLAGSEGQECGRMGYYMLEEFKRYVNGESLRWQVKKEYFDILA
ncbi:hydroxyacid dehydrogenase [Gracilibacillus caseinilyticus]|uniref:Hydroxyacid dehydrogenase n=1 Tax=Gracilibacillus caseinilyticus TaxID=2932256 RepID=A0ABY4ERP2_9BACI|nr:hydroxyacid dehydrogenase [Gracilibacillus caseinilyticus]UOQ46572.1 hydroxyacid dehydrogenase [Gracilibacillus caseinilyticus]